MTPSIRSALPFLSAACLLLAGCVGEAESALEQSEHAAPEEVEPAGKPLLHENALSLNALSLNALSLNALSLNALSLNALSPSALSSIQAPGSSGQLARHALRYIVSCSLGKGASFGFSWVDSAGVQHAENYPGLLGLASGWASGPIGEVEERWVSACLMARVNWYGVSVLISSRGHHGELKKATDQELAEFTHPEGAFWGNLFSNTPEAYACYEPAEAAYVRQKQRDCAAGHLGTQGMIQSCGMIQILGACENYCKQPQPKWGYRKDCQAAPGSASKTDQVMTVFLD